MHGKIKACIQVCLGKKNTVALCDSGNLSNMDLSDYWTFKQAYAAELNPDVPQVTAFNCPQQLGTGFKQLNVVGQVKVPLVIKGVWPCWQSKIVLVRDLRVPMILSAKTLAQMPAVINLARAIVLLGPYGQRVPLVTTTDETSAPDVNEPLTDCHKI